MNLIFRCLTVLLTLIGNEAVFAFSGIGNTLDFGELAAFPGAAVSYTHLTLPTKLEV